MDIQEIMYRRFKEEQARKVVNYQQLNKVAQKGQILFTGSSLMEQFPVVELAVSDGLNKVVYNRGIGGYTTDDFLEAIGPMLLDLEPKKVFINIGTNDIKERDDQVAWDEHLLNNYEKILQIAKEKLPDTEFYLMAFYPVNLNVPEDNSWFKTRTTENLAMINGKVAQLAEKFGYHFINVNEGLADEEGNLKPEYTIEGVHMYPEAYTIVYKNIKPYI